MLRLYVLLENKNLDDFGYKIPPTIWFGSSKQKRKTWAKCELCDRESIVTYYNYLQNKKKNGIYSCMKCTFNTDEAKLQRSKQSKQAWKNKSYRKCQIDRINKLFKSEEHKKLVSERNKSEYKIDPGKYLREKVYALHTEKARKNHKKAVNKQKYKDLHRELAKNRFKNDEYKIKIAKGIEKFYSSGNRSRPEKIFANILNNLNIEYESERAVGPYNFDFYLPKHDAFIDVQGEYWHNLPHNSKRDKAKLSYLMKSFPNSKLIYIWENELLSTGKVAEKLKNQLKLSIQCLDDFDIRSVKVRICQISDSEIFLRTWHYAQEGKKPKFVIGAYLESELIAVCKFSPLSRKETALSSGYTTKEIFELDRFCISPNRHKKNFATWFLSRCTKMFLNEFKNVKAVVSFADTTYGHVGTIYKAANWVLVSTVKPDYVYVDSNGWMMHKKTLYNHARSCKMKESSYAEKHNYKKVFGKEKLKFLFTR